MSKNLVLIVACDAARHLEPQLALLPAECTDGERYRLLVIDDASSDRTVEADTGWLRDRGMTDAVVRIPPRGWC